jgi:integrase
MSLYRRGETWWTDFTVCGRRYRMSTEKANFRQAQDAEKKLIADAGRGLIGAGSPSFTRKTPFSDALQRYIDEREHLGKVRDKTIRIERERGKVLKAAFSRRPPGQFTADVVNGFIEIRKKAGISNATVNRELDVLRGILKRAKLWWRVAEDVKPLKLDNQDTGRVLTFEEKTKLLAVAKKRADWKNARLAMQICLNTTMRPGEIANLQWRDVSLLDNEITVRRSKTVAGVRVIPMNADALAAALELREICKLEFGDPQPEWFLFPGRVYPTWKRTPTRPQKSWADAWRAIRKKAGLTLRFYDLRHQAITELAENPEVSEETIRGLAGHVSRKMLERYSHARMKAKRSAVGTLGSGLPVHVTNHVTNAPLEENEPPQVIEEIGGRQGTRTPGLLVANEALFQLS